VRKVWRRVKVLVIASSRYHGHLLAFPCVVGDAPCSELFGGVITAIVIDLFAQTLSQCASGLTRPPLLTLGPNCTRHSTLDYETCRARTGRRYLWHFCSGRRVRRLYSGLLPSVLGSVLHASGRIWLWILLRATVAVSLEQRSSSRKCESRGPVANILEHVDGLVHSRDAHISIQ
jgi:hypothetical protein